MKEQPMMTNTASKKRSATGGAPPKAAAAKKAKQSKKKSSEPLSPGFVPQPPKKIKSVEQAVLRMKHLLRTIEKIQSAGSNEEEVEFYRTVEAACEEEIRKQYASGKYNNVFNKNNFQKLRRGDGKGITPCCILWGWISRLECQLLTN